MSGEEFKDKLESFFTYLLENIKEHNDHINNNFNELKELCKNK